MAWTLYELSRRPDYQARVREELRNGPADYESTPLLNAAINVLVLFSRTDHDIHEPFRNRSVCIPSSTHSPGMQQKTTLFH